ncbi:MAG: hypothetical protein HOO00_03975 [Rhodospirillaceae bacterium]|jgi:invasion protein IalB|nr:hypothetical protein [Rhodospirillaceae bacterium]MBT5373573.1 hypothetical protein [Rhodospirillaceae bacterium]MBT5751104.1 hypothetical protein [Rhodospirillaceae bacterium]
MNASVNTALKTVLFVFALLLPVLSGKPVLAGVPEHSGTYSDWNVFTFDDGAGKVCYLASQPIKSTGKYKTRGEVHFLVTHYAKRKEAAVINIITGYTYKENSDVLVSIGGNEFELFTDGDKAWAFNEAADRAFVIAMKRGRNMTVKGKSSRGTQTTDIFSLTGFSAAFKAAGKACGK